MTNSTNDPSTNSLFANKRWMRSTTTKEKRQENFKGTSLPHQYDAFEIANQSR